MDSIVYEGDTKYVYVINIRCPESTMEAFCEILPYEIESSDDDQINLRPVYERIDVGVLAREILEIIGRPIWFQIHEQVITEVQESFTYDTPDYNKIMGIPIHKEERVKSMQNVV